MSQISIIIPVYNAEKTLIKCLDSVQRQTYKDYEVILINDGSSDNSAEICQKYCARDERFKLVNQENGGPSKARNRGIDEAKSKYIMFVDSDDYIEQDMLDTLFVATEASSADLTICGYYVENDNCQSVNTLKYPLGVYREGDLRRIVLEALDIGKENNIKPYSWIRFLKKECLEEPKLRFNTNIYRSEDYLIWNILFSRIKTVCLIGDKPLYHYVMNNSSITHRYVKNYWEMSKIIYRELKEVYKNDKEAEMHLNIMLLRRATISLTIASLAPNKETFNKDVKKVLKDKELRDVLKEIPFRIGVKSEVLRYLLFKFKLNYVIKLLFKLKYSKNIKRQSQK